MPVWVSIQGAQQMKDLARKLKDADRGDLRKKLRSKIKDAGAPVVEELRSAVMGVKVTRGDDPFARRTRETGIAPRPSTTRWGPRSTGLRARVSKSMTISQTQRGIRIKASAARIGDYGNTLPKYLDGTIGRYRSWRHPVYGNTEVWVTQYGSPWFFIVINKHRAEFRKAVFDAMSEIADELTS